MAAENGPVTFRAQNGPITFRARSAQSRAMLEAVAQHREVSLSKLVADAMETFAHQYIANVGPEKFAADLKEAAEQRERSLARQLEEMVAQAGIAPSGSSRDTGGSMKSSSDQ